MRLSSDGRSLTIGDATGKLSIVEVASGGERVSFKQGGMILSAAFHWDGTKVVASSPEAPVYVWDLLAETGAWDASKSDSLWEDLASPDAKRAFTAMRQLRASPKGAISLMRERLKVTARLPEPQITALLKQLDSAKFVEREQAQTGRVLDVVQKAPDRRSHPCFAALFSFWPLRLFRFCDRVSLDISGCGKRGGACRARRRTRASGQ